jgi:hypothetical protein
MKLSITKIKKISTIIVFAIAFVGLGCFVFAQVETVVNKHVLGDSDQDGLSDSEEATYGTDPNNADSDGDGYSDGVEITSGYDPLKPAPGDRVAFSSAKQASDLTDAANLTGTFSDTINEFIAKKESSNEAVSMNEINDLITGSLGEKIGGAITFETLPKIEVSQLNIKKQDYEDLSETERSEKLHKDSEKYLSDILYLLFTNAPQTITSESEFNEFKRDFVEHMNMLSTENPDYDYFRNFASKMETASQQAQKIEVPESLVETHVKLIQLIDGYLALRDPSLPAIEDPVTRVIIMSRARMLIELTGEFFKSADAALSQNTSTPASDSE